MFIDLLSESCEEGEESLYWVTKMSQYLEDMFVQISLNFCYLLQASSGKTNSLGLRMPLFYWPYLGSVHQEVIVIIIKHHTYTLHIQATYKHT